MLKSYQYRIYPTKKQSKILQHQLEECRWLYNQLLEQKIKHYQSNKTYLSAYEQMTCLPDLKEGRKSLSSVNAQVLQNIAVRIDLAFQAFFRRLKAGQKPGFPRFKAAGRYDSMTFPQTPSRCEIKDGFLRTSKVGKVKIVIHRKLEGIPKTATIKRSNTGKWYVRFSCDNIKIILLIPHKKKTVGIDVGLTTFATLSNKTEIKRERFFKKDQDALGKAQRKLEKSEKQSQDYIKHKKSIARIHERIKFRRNDFCHQWSRKIINKFGIIFVEDLEVNRMVRNKLYSKGISDVAWSAFSNYLSYKAEEAGRIFVKVNPAYTSQTCSGCGHRQEMPPDLRVYRCPTCKSELDRDYNASLNILALGLQSMGMGFAQNPSSSIH